MPGTSEPAEVRGEGGEGLCTQREGGMALPLSAGVHQCCSETRRPLLDKLVTMEILSSFLLSGPSLVQTSSVFPGHGISWAVSL